MIHNPWTVSLGDAREMRKTAEVLDKIGGSLVGIYAARTGESREEIQRLMDEESWFDATEAEEIGFADATEDRETEAPAAFDLSVFSRVPDRLAARAGDRKPAPKIETIRDLESFLRDEGGLSHAAARRVAAGGFRAPTDPRDEDGARRAELVAAIERRGTALANLHPR